jgi:hypothetical protein
VHYLPGHAICTSVETLCVLQANACTIFKDITAKCPEIISPLVIVSMADRALTAATGSPADYAVRVVVLREALAVLAGLSIHQFGSHSTIQGHAAGINLALRILNHPGTKGRALLLSLFTHSSLRMYCAGLTYAAVSHTAYP